MKNIKAIIFDLGAVILNIKCQNTTAKFSNLGVKGDEITVLFPDRVQ